MRFRLPPGVHSHWSTTYVDPDQEIPPGWPTAREPGVRLRVVPNETLLPGPLGSHLGELIQALVDEGADLGIAIDLDTSDRTRPGERRGGASPVEVISLMLLGGAAAKFGRRQLERLGDRFFDAAVAWVMKHRRKETARRSNRCRAIRPRRKSDQERACPTGAGRQTA